MRIAAVQPQIDDQGRMLVAVTVISRRVEDLDAFIEELERTEAFSSVLSAAGSHRGRRRAAIGDSGLLRPRGAVAAAQATDARREPRRATNASPAHRQRPRTARDAARERNDDAALRRRRRGSAGARHARASRRARAARRWCSRSTRSCSASWCCRCRSALRPIRRAPTATERAQSAANAEFRQAESVRDGKAQARQPISRRSTRRCCRPTSPRRAG